MVLLKCSKMVQNGTEEASVNEVLDSIDWPSLKCSRIIDTALIGYGINLGKIAITLYFVEISGVLYIEHALCKTLENPIYQFTCDQ